jgi:hypothetical protein
MITRMISPSAFTSEDLKWNCPPPLGAQVLRLLPREYDVKEEDWTHVVFVGGFNNYKFWRALQRPLRSLMWNRRSPVHVHLIGYDPREIVHTIQRCNHYMFRITAHRFDIPSSLYNDIRPWNPNKLKLMVDWTLRKTKITRVIVLDLDIAIYDDIGLLNKEFDRMGPDQAIGVVPEYFNQYGMDRRNISFSGETCIRAVHYDGHDGVNTGVALWDFKKLRAKRWWNDIKRTTERIRNCKQPMGDQDITNDFLYDHPHLLYYIPYEWHMQYYCFQPTHFSDRTQLKCKKNMYKGKVKIGHWNGSAPYGEFVGSFLEKIASSALDSAWLNELVLKAHNEEMAKDVDTLVGFIP